MKRHGTMIPVINYEEYFFLKFLKYLNNQRKYRNYTNFYKDIFFTRKNICILIKTRIVEPQTKQEILKYGKKVQILRYLYDPNILRRF